MSEYVRYLMKKRFKNYDFSKYYVGFIDNLNLLLYIVNTFFIKKVIFCDCKKPYKTLKGEL